MHVSHDDHESWMAVAFREAERAASEGEVPVGAVIVHGGRVIGRGHNRTEGLNDPTAHAEIVVIGRGPAREGLEDHHREPLVSGGHEKDAGGPIEAANSCRRVYAFAHDGVLELPFGKERGERPRPAEIETDQAQPRVGVLAANVLEHEGQCQHALARPIGPHVEELDGHGGARPRLGIGRRHGVVDHAGTTTALGAEGVLRRTARDE